MAWKKSPPSLVELFARVFPQSPGAETRQMFGYPAGFVNGNLFVGLFEDRLLVRLDERGRKELLAVDEAEPFEPMKGRPMREYVVLPIGMHDEEGDVRHWVERALEYARALPPKSKSKRKPRPKATKGRR
jgi:TfoX/Sxy family transcriptional regulator of competence genes